MSTEIDKRVVEMQFNNKDFEKNVQASLTTIDKLKMALNFDGAKGLDSITKAANKVDMSNIVDQTKKVELSFSALQVAGATTVSELTKKLISFSTGTLSKMWNASFGQMKSGGMSRALNIEQANFKMQALVEKMDQFAGKTEEVKKFMTEMGNSIEWAVNGTAYGYDAAAGVAAQLMASGLTDTEQMAKDLRTVAGAAAMTGRSYENMGQIFAAVAGQGKLMGDQLLQFSSSGVNAASTIAKYLHTTEADVRDMVTKGKIDFRTFANAMEEAFAESAGRADETFAGVTSNVRAQLSRIGQIFAQPFIKNMIPLLQKVKNALKQFKNALVPTGERFDYIFGRLTNWAAGVVFSLDFSRLDTIIRGVENIFWGLASVLYTVHEAFEEVFTRKTLEELNNSAIAFEKFTKAILPTEDVLNGVKTVSKGVMIGLRAIVNAAVKLTEVIKPLAFAILRILGAVVSLTRHFQPIMDHLAELVKESKVLEAISLIISDIVLKLTDLIIGFLDVIDGLIGRFMELDVIKEFGNALIDIYKVLSTLFIVIITLLGAAIGKLLGYLNIDSLAKVWSKFAGILKTIGSFIGFIALGLVKMVRILLNASSIFEGIKEIFDSIVALVKSIFTSGDVSTEVDNVSNAASNLKNVFQGLIDKFKEAWKELNLGRVILVLFAFGILALIFSVNELINSFSKLVGAATRTVNSVTTIQSSVSNMAKSVAKYSAPSQFLISFAIALGAFTASVTTLTNEVDPNRLKEIAPVIGMFIAGIIAAAAAMGWANKYFDKSVGLSVLAANMLAVSGSMLLLTFAIKAMAGVTQDLGSLISVTVSVILMMTGFAGSVAILSNLAPKFEASMISILAFSAGIYITVKALKQLENLDISGIWRQTILLSGLMIALGAAIGLAGRAGSIYKKDEKTLYKRGGVGFTLLAFAVSMLVLLQVLKELCSMPTEKLKSGLTNLRNIMMSFMPLITIIAIASKLSGNGGMLVRDIASLFTSLSLALVAMFGAVWLFAKTMNPEELARGVEAVKDLINAITFFLAGIMLLPLLISAFAQIKTGKMMNLGSSAIKELSSVLVSMSILMLAISACTKLVSTSTDEDIYKIISLLGMLGLITIGIESMIGHTRGAKAAPIIATMALIGVVVASIAFLAAAVMTNGIDMGTLFNIMAGLSLVLAALGVLFMGIGHMNRAVQKAPAQAKKLPANFNPNKPQTSGLESVAIILGVAAIMASLALLFSYAAGMPWQQLVSIFGGLTVVFLALTLFVERAKKVGPQSIQQAQAVGLFILPAVLALAGVVGAFAWITNIIQNNDTGSWAVALLILAGMITVIGIVFKQIVDSANLNVLKSAGINMKETMALFAVIGGVIAGLMLAVAAIMAIPVNPTGLGEKIAMVVIVLAAFAGILALSKAIDIAGVNTIALAMLEMGGAFLMIAAAIALIASTPTDDQAGKKMAWLLGAFVVITAAAALIGAYVQAVNVGGMLALAGSVAIMSASLIIMALAMKELSTIDKEADLDKASNILVKMLSIFTILAIAAGVVGATKVGTGVAIGIIALCGSLLMFSTALMFTAKSFDIFVDALTKFSKLTGEQIEQVIGNFRRFLHSLPDIANDLIQFGPYISVIVATWITNIALGIGSALGAIMTAVGALIIGVCNGLVAGLPTVLNTLATIIRECNNWIIENKDIWIDTGRALTIAIMGVVQGVVDGFFEYFDVKLSDLWQSIEDAKKAMEDNEEVKRTGSERMRDSMVEYYKTLGDDVANGRATNKAFVWLDELQKRIDAGVITYEDAQEAVRQAGLETYKDYIQEMGKFNGEQIKEGTNLRKQLELSATDSGEKALAELKNNLMEAKKANRDFISDDARNNYINGLNQLIADGSISYRLAMLQLYDIPGMAIYSDRLIQSSYNTGIGTTEAVADGIKDGNEEVQKAADETVSIVEEANDKIEASGGGGAMSTKAVHSISNNGLRNMSLSQLQVMRDTFSNQANMDELGKGMAEDGGEAFTDQAEKENWITKIGNIFKPVADALGVDLGEILANGMTQGLSSSDIIGMIGAAFTGEEYKTQGMWKEYYNEMVPIVKEINGMEKTVGSQSRWRAEGFESLQQALEENTKTGKDYFDWMHGGVGGALDEVNSAITDMMPNMNELTSGLGDLGDAADYATDYTDKLKESVEKSLDVFTAFNKEVKTTSRDVLKNLYSQIEGVSKWSEELQALASRGLNQNFIKELAEEGPSAYDRIHAFYTMTEADMALFNKMYAEELVMKDQTALDIRKSWLDAGIIPQDEYDKFATEIGTKYDEAVLRAQQEAASKKNGQMSASTKKNLDSMYKDIERYQADADFINKWRDNNAEIGKEGAEALTETMEDKTKEGIIGTAAYIEAGKDMVEDIGEGIENQAPKIVDGMANLGKASMEALKKSIKMEEALTPINEFRKGVYQQVKSSLNLFETVETKTEEELKKEQISTTQMLYNMQENAKKVGQWSYNLRKLAARGMTEGLVEELRQMGPEAADTIDAFVRMTDDELKEANSLYSSAMTMPNTIADQMTSTYAEQGFAIALGLKDGIDEGKEDLLAEMYKIGEESSEGFKRGIDPDAAKNAMEMLGDNSLKAICDILLVKSPSRAMKQIGIWVVEGYLLGIGAGIKEVSKKAMEIGHTTISKFNEAMPISKFKSIGENVIKGINVGLNNSMSLVSKSIATVADKIMTGLTGPLKIKSPSQFAAYCAEMLNQGFANEMDDNTLMIDSTTSKAEEIKNAMAEQLLNIGNTLDSGDVYEPVIRPVWDMTSIQSGYQSITDVLGRTPLNVNGSINAANAANRTAPSQDAIMITNAINNLTNEQRAIRNDLSNIRSEMSNFDNRLNNIYVRLDGNALVGELVAPLDKAMGKKVISQKRGRM